MENTLQSLATITVLKVEEKVRYLKSKCPLSDVSCKSPQMQPSKISFQDPRIISRIPNLLITARYYM